MIPSSSPHQTSVPLLEVSNLGISFGRPPTLQAIIRDVEFSLDRGESLGIVGESGSGKSMTARAVAGLLAPGANVDAGSVRFKGVDVASMDDRTRRQLLGTEIGMIFQDPLGSLNPVMRVGDQIAEGMRIREGASKAESRKRVLDLMEAVGIPTPDRLYRAYPHEFSGGMRQRVVIAIALSMNPDLVIADEPTTALDVTVAAKILDLLRTLCSERDAALILISHDVRTVVRATEKTLVMYAGRVVEIGDTEQIANNPQHPYTKGLLASVPPHDRQLNRLPTIDGHSESAADVATSCAFAPRCSLRLDICTNEVPVLSGPSSDRTACFAVEAGRDQ